MRGLSIEITGLVVSFDGFHAVDEVDLTIVADELRFLIGPNGAGKTTLIDAVTGKSRAASGSIRLAGTELVGKREEDIVRLGVGRTFQTPTVLVDLTVVANVDLALRRRDRLLSLLRPAPPAEREQVRAILDVVGLGADAGVRAGELSHGARKWLEIGMLLAQDARVLLLDEPVAGMTRPERQRTGELLARIAGDRTVVVVEHDMEFLRSYAQTVSVLHEGRLLAEGSVDEVQADPRVVEVYLGRGGKDSDAVAKGA